MVAIFTGAGTGFERGSGNVLGSSGLLGSANMGRGGDQLFLNAATGNLLVNRQDEFLVGRGPDVGISRTYNSLGNQSDDNGDNWLQSTDRRVFDLTGTANSWGSTVKRRSGDGSEITYEWNGSAYVSSEGAGSYDKLTYNGSSWTWTDGDSQVTETYAVYGSYWRIDSQSDASGNGVTFGYSGDKLTTITTADGGQITYAWSGNRITQVTSGDGTATFYSYDGYGRLSQVDVELSGGGSTYFTRYDYVGSSRLISRMEQADGSIIEIGYDSANRVTSWTETVNGSTTRTTTISYGANYTAVTDPLGQVTRFDYAAGNAVPRMETWNKGNMTQAPATIDGRAATSFTNVATGWAAAYYGYSATAGETLNFAVTVQGDGSVTSQMFGLYGDSDNWGANGASSARIISGPGTLVQVAGGAWQINGLSSTTGTRVEITRTFRQTETGGVYLYGDNPGGYRAGTSLIVADPVLTRSSALVDTGYMDGANWYVGGVSRSASGTIDGGPAYQYTITDSSWAGTAFWQNVSAGDRLSYSISLQAIAGSATSQHLGLWGENSGWGLPANSTARIVSGPGTLTQDAGGLWIISGLSTSQPTRVEIVRTYDRAEVSGAYLYVDGPNGFRLGQSLIAGAPYVVRQTGENARANQLTQITTGYGTSQAQSVQFGYNDYGDLTSVIDPLGNATSYTYDANGNLLTSTDRLGNTVTRTYDAYNRLVTETRIGADKDSGAAAHTTRYVYNAAHQLIYVVSPEGKVTRNWYDTAGQLYWINDFPNQSYDVSSLGASEALTQLQLDTWCGTLGDTSAAETTWMLYDTHGNMVQRARAVATGSYSSYDGTAGATIEYFSYDAAGHLLSSQVQGQAARTYSYDGLGRIVSQVDPASGTTTFVFDDFSTQTTVTLGNGLVQFSTYDKVGNLLSYRETGNAVLPNLSWGSTITDNQYDKDGRLRISTDASGVTSYYVYDALGRLAANVNGYGAMTEYRYDAGNRLIATVRYNNVVSGTALTQLANPDYTPDINLIRPAADGLDLWGWTVYDKEGRVLETIEGDGSVAANEYDASGRLVRTTAFVNKLSSGQLDAFKANGPSAWVPGASAEDRVSRIFYDKDGNTIGALDGEGYLSRIVYDGAGRKVQVIAYFNAINPAYRASGTFQTLIDNVVTRAEDRSTRYVYDGLGRLRFTIDAVGNVVEHDYGEDSAAFAERRTVQYGAPLGAVANYDYKTVKEAVSYLWNSPNRTSYTVYDSAGRIAYSIDALGAVVSYGYDAVGQVIKQTAFATLRATSTIPTKGDVDSWVSTHRVASDRTTRFYYAENGDLRFTIDAEGYVTRFNYDAAGRKTWEGRWSTPLSPQDSWTLNDVANALPFSGYISRSYSYDAAGRLEYEYDGEGVATWHGYRANGQLSQTVRAIGTDDRSDTYFHYDAANRLYARYDAAGTAEEARSYFSYNGFGELVTAIDPNGHATNFGYDHLGRKITQTDALGKVTSYGYNGFGEQVSVTDALSHTSYSYYDNAGRVIMVRDAENYITETSYTVFGEIAWVKQYYQKATNTASALVPPDGYGADSRDATTRFTYDKLSRVKTTTDAEFGIETNWYDAFGNKTKVQNKIGGIVNYSYDRRGLLRYETVGAIYDGEGNFVSNGYTSSYRYDERGNLVQQTEGDGLPEQRSTYFQYDKNDRLTVRSTPSASVGLTPYNSTSSESYSYDKRGNLISTTDAVGARTVNFYDDLDRVVATVQQTGSFANPRGVLSTYLYDAVGNLLSGTTYETLVAMPSAFPRGPQPASPAGNYRRTTNTYDNVNRLTSTSLANQAYGYWNGGSYVYDNGASNTLSTYYEYDFVGNLLRTTAADGSVAYSYYDALGRKLGQVDAGSYLTSWTYDAEGNVTEERRWANQVTGVSLAGYSASAATADRVTQFAYDRMGRRTQEKRLGVEAWSLNAGNGQLYAAATESIVQYSYNALGQVLTKGEATGDTTTYEYDNIGRLTREMRQGYNGVTPTVRYNYNVFGELVSTRQGDAAIAGGDKISSNVYDVVGRLASSTDAEGNVRYYRYDAAGRKIGEYYDRELGDGTAIGNGTIVREGISYTYDLAGNLVRQAVNIISGGSWNEVSSTQSAYNAFGEVTDRGTNVAAGSAPSSWQEHFSYDNIGQLIRTNSGDGVLRYYAYDQVGRQTLMLESEGLSIYNWSQWDAAANTTLDGVNATITQYDARGQAITTVQRQRETSIGGPRADIYSRRGYTAFGEVAWESDAYDHRTDYSYNSMGRVTQVKRPTVWMTSESGAQSLVNPTEFYFYDISGRMIGKQDANSTGVKTTQQLLAGTGYGEGEALVVKEWHPDGGAVTYGYNLYGDQVSVTDEIGRYTSMAYDRLGQLIAVLRPGNWNGSLSESYSYDILGQRIGHWLSVNGTAYAGGFGGRERTQYDALGRVVSQRAFGGETVTTSYEWQPGMQTTGMTGSGDAYGGWLTITTYANGLNSQEKTDAFGHLTWARDMGGHESAMTYDLAGRMIQRVSGSEIAAYSWLSNGKLGQVKIGADGTASQTTFTQDRTSYTYDLMGNQVLEVFNRLSGAMYDNGHYEYSYEYGYYDQYWVSDWQYQTSDTLISSQSASYDSLNRLTGWSALATATMPAAATSYEYDANSNIRRSVSTFHILGQDGSASGATSTQDYWYRYDTMNRVVTAKGVQSGGTIARGTQGVDIFYDLAGQRAQTITQYISSVNIHYQVYDPNMYNGWGGYQDIDQTVEFEAESRESYTYWGNGTLYNVLIASSGATDNHDGTITVTPPPVTPLRKATYWYDPLGRLERQIDWGTDPDSDPNALNTAIYDRLIQYNANGQISFEEVHQRQGGIEQTTQTTNTYTDGNGTYYLGAVVSSQTSVWRTNVAFSTTYVSNSYGWYDGATLQSSTVTGTTSGTTTYNYNGFGQLIGASIMDGRPRYVTYTNDTSGQTIRRDEPLTNPHEVWYRFGGKQMGYVGNNGTYDTDYQTSVASRVLTNGTGGFRDGSSYGQSYSDFDQFYNPITTYKQGGAGGTYTVQGGETLASIAAALWGDSSLWFRLAEANGLSSGSALFAGQRLTIPTGVNRSTYNATTFQPYDPAAAMGDTSPTTPTPQAQPKPKKGGCGVLGTILIAVVAIAITVALKAPVGKMFAALFHVGGATSGAAFVAANIATGATLGVAASAGSQLFGVATGLQDKFSWKAVAMAGISGGIGGAAGANGFFDVGSKVANAAITGVITSVAAQGIAMATGLQSKFDWAGVAAAGIGAAASSAIKMDGFAGKVVRNTAGGIANAAARSLISGTDFGDNVLAALPDIIAQTVGDLMSDAMTRSRAKNTLNSIGAALGSGVLSGLSSLGGSAGISTFGTLVASMPGDTDPQGNTVLPIDNDGDGWLSPLDLVAGIRYTMEGAGHARLVGGSYVSGGSSSSSQANVASTAKAVTFDKVGTFDGGGSGGASFFEFFRDLPSQSYSIADVSVSMGREYFGPLTADQQRDLATRIGSEIVGMARLVDPTGYQLRGIQSTLSQVVAGDARFGGTLDIVNTELALIQLTMDQGLAREGRDFARMAGRIAENAPLVSGMGSAVRILSGDESLSEFGTNAAMNYFGGRIISSFGGKLLSLLPEVRPADVNLAGGTFDVVGDASRYSLNSPRLSGFENVEGTIVSGRSVHPNSLSYVGDTHVYAIRGPDGSLYKIGESTQGVRVGDGASIRAEQQARKLFKETGDVYRTEIRANFGNKADARAYETRFIQTYTRLFGRPPGNPLNR